MLRSAMKLSKHLLVGLIFLFCLSGASVARAQVPEFTPLTFDPPAVYLTWQRDPSTTMTVCWQTLTSMQRVPRLEVQKTNETVWRAFYGVNSPMPHSDRVTHRVQLENLAPATEYRFRFGPDSRSFTFRTMPARAERPIRFATGGDTMHEKRWWENTNRQAMKYDPDFVLLGGDLFYEDGSPSKVQRVYDWLDGAKKTLVTESGRMVPVIASIGNHEVAGSFEKTPAEAPFYYHLFPFLQTQGYKVLDFGDYMSLVILDSGHTNTVGGKQTAWLAGTLQQRRDVPHVFPIYHVPGYPSVRAFEEKYSAQVREHWSPLFDQFGVKVAFENHDHAYKRTHPIRGGKIDFARGVTYLGDGAWGVGVRDVHPDSWYLAKAVKVRHFILVTLQGRNAQYQAIDEEGRVIDQYPEAPLLSATATNVTTAAR
jgi:hypothetical protein